MLKCLDQCCHAKWVQACLSEDSAVDSSLWRSVWPAFKHHCVPSWNERSMPKWSSVVFNYSHCPQCNLSESVFLYSGFSRLKRVPGFTHWRCWCWGVLTCWIDFAWDAWMHVACIGNLFKGPWTSSAFSLLWLVTVCKWFFPSSFSRTSPVMRKKLGWWDGEGEEEDTKNLLYSLKHSPSWCNAVEFV